MATPVDGCASGRGDSRAALLAQQSVTRKKMLARTRVDFALLGSTDEEDGDE